MAQDKFHTIVVGGGCLGCASAISVQRRLGGGSEGGHSSVCVIERSVVGSGVTARHSGIVRAANAVPEAAVLAQKAIAQWRNLKSLWGVAAPFEACGAIWIAKDAGPGENSSWDGLESRLKSAGIEFGRIPRSRADELTPGIIDFHDDEVFFYEPGAIQMDPSAMRKMIYEALDINAIEVREKTAVTGFECGEDGRITGVLTSQGRLGCEFVVNAAGAWSPAVFGSLGIAIPVSAEPVHVANWITSLREFEKAMPIIADYVNLAYFRLWRNGEIHMHQPRKRSLRETARVFAGNPLGLVGADFINDPANQGLDYAQIHVYEQIARRRFNNIDRTVYGSGYRSFFDITPDLRFILGRDHRIPNLVHCLGAGQSFKYTPVFGEIIAESIFGGTDYAEEARAFSISRFDDAYMHRFWTRVSGRDKSVEIGAAAAL